MKKLIISFIKKNRFLFISSLYIKHLFHFKSSKTKDKIIEHLYENGYYVINNFLSSSECDNIVSELENNLFLSKEFDNDKRIFGSQHINKKINKSFFNNKFLKEITKKYLNSNIINQSTLYGKLKFKTGSVLGSGGDWHIDSFSRQFKAMVYLSDVNEDNGPFQYVEKSHKIYHSMNFLFKNWNSLKEITRFDNSLVSEYCRICDLNIKKLTGKKGTLILFDPIGFHRGTPILRGERHALTNYYIRSTDRQKNNNIEMLDVKTLEEFSNN